MRRNLLPLSAFVGGFLFVLGWPRLDVLRRPSRELIENPEAAHAYDRISRWPQFKVLRRLVIWELQKLHPQGTLVDVGCGPGYLVAEISRVFPALRVVGVDGSQTMIETAAQNLACQDLLERVEFRVGDVKQLPFEDGSVDFVVSTLSMHHWSDPRQAFSEIQRILKPGGQFLVFDVRRDVRRAFYWLVRFVQSIVAPPPIRSIGEPTGSFLAAYTPSEVKDMLRHARDASWRVDGGPAWMFVSGQKMTLQQSKTRLLATIASPCPHVLRARRQT